MPEMIERVARVLEKQAWAALEASDTLAYRNRRTSSLRKARAAIEAMCAPTEAMLEAVVKEPTHLYGDGIRGEDYQRQMKAAVGVERAVTESRWRDMIDAALA